MPKRRPEARQQTTLDAFLKKGKRKSGDDVSTGGLEDAGGGKRATKRSLPKPHLLLDMLTLKSKLTEAMKTRIVREDGCLEQIKTTTNDVQSGTSVDIDRTGLLAVGGGNSITIGEVNPFLESVELTRVKHTVSSVRWDKLSDSRLITSFNNHPGLWIFDLEVCDENNPTPVTTLSGPRKGILRTSQYQSITVGASKDGKSYLWDCRSGSSHVGSVSHSGAFDDNKKTPQFGVAHGVQKDTSKVSFPVTAIHLFDNTLLTGTANGVVSEYDFRFLKSGSINSVSVSGKTADDMGHEIRGPVPEVRKNSIQDLQPSPFLKTTAVALTGSCLVEIDLPTNTIVRCYAPPEHFISDIPEQGEGERTNAGGVFSNPLASDLASEDVGPAKSFAWSAILSSFILPCAIGCRVIPWESKTNWVKWTPNAAENAADELTFSSACSDPTSIYRVDLQSSGIAAAITPVDWSFVSATGSAFHTSSWG